MLAQMLNQHPLLACADELFLRDASQAHCYHVDRARSLRARTHPLASRVRYANDVLSLSAKPITGFKLMIDQAMVPLPGVEKVVGRLPRLGPALVSPTWVEYLRSAVVLHVVRENVADVVLSKIFAEASGSFHGTIADSDTAVRVDVGRFLRECERSEVRLHVARRVAQRFNAVELRYDDGVAAMAAGAQDALGVTREQLAPTLAKRVQRPLPMLIENHQELLAALSNTQFRLSGADADVKTVYAPID